MHCSCVLSFGGHSSCCCLFLFLLSGHAALIALILLLCAPGSVYTATAASLCRSLVRLRYSLDDWSSCLFADRLQGLDVEYFMHAVLKVRSKAGTGQLAEQGLFSSAHERIKATSSVGGRGV